MFVQFIGTETNFNCDRNWNNITETLKKHNRNWNCNWKITAEITLVRWRFGSLELTSEASIPVGKNILMLADIRQSATYTCVAESQLGIVEHDVQVTVTGLSQRWTWSVFVRPIQPNPPDYKPNLTHCTDTRTHQIRPLTAKYAKASILWLRFRPHRSTTYVDAAYCYRPSSMVCLSVRWSVCHTSKGKGNEYRTPWGVLVGCSSPLLRPWARRWINHSSLWRMASATPDLRLPSQSQGIAAPRPLELQANALAITPPGYTLVSPAKTAELIEMPFGMWTRVGPRKHVLVEVHTGATQRIPLYRPCAAAMRPFCQIA